VKAAVSGDGLFDGEKVPALVERHVTKANGESATERVLVVDRAYVEKQVAGIVKNQDLSRYIL
jgi:ATP-dependent HslUV protease ATP-binding subunit HslU